MSDDPRWADFRSRNEAVMTDARAAVQSAIIVNGGAFATLLAFVGSQTDTSRLHVEPAGIRSSLLAFSIGVGFGFLATATSYLTNYGYLSQTKSLLEQANNDGKSALKYAIVSHYLSIGLITGSAIAFGFGAYTASVAIR